MRLFTLILLGATAMTAPAHSADLVLKRAVLGTGGVGYFEYEATVTGKETLTLRSRLDQVDDILKSMIILDPAGTGSATLPGKAGADEAFNALPFSRSDLDSMASLMTALKGAEIKVAAPRSIAGRIASVQPEQVTDKDGRTITRTRVSVFSGASMDQFILEDAQGLEFADTRLGEQVTGALTALRSAQDRSGRDISIHLADGAQRTVRIGYVAEAPVWKTAYRLTLPKAGEDKAQLQGWVVLENMTGDAWKDVAVTLSSAAPVTFRQALYDPYYVSRQTIAPPVSQAALPRTDQGQVALGGAGYAEIAVPAAPEQQRIMRSRKIEAVQDGMVQQTETAPPASTEENAAGASFTLSVPVSVGSGESLTIPFVDQKVPAEAVAWYQGGGRNPWQGMTLKNDGSTSLPAGSATIYEATDAGPLFSGEAQFPLLPAGDSRLVGFGAEQKILVDRENRTASAVTKVKSVNGALQIESKLRETTLYRVKNIAAEARRMVIEQPRAQDWRLVQPKAEEATLAGSAYRMRFEVEPGKTREFPVVMERPVVETVAIQELTAERILALIASTELDAESKARLAAIAEAARASDEASQVLASRQERRDGITADQERIRENIGAAPEGSDLARLYAQKMLDQERALEQLDKDIVDARTKYEEARRVLGDRVRAF
ncbi:MAG: DUF4139 domain-containing protein [Aquamicrobium sp.]|nr:DUF4139 domain-containing protein [Aquamicrobium sp.]QAZ44482.1 hypothetical protein C1M53_17600 [Mesorhizobium sp. Pch-S]